MRPGSTNIAAFIFAIAPSALSAQDYWQLPFEP
jgi:hypothetical protein